jgi:hypothetical protein
VADRCKKTDDFRDADAVSVIGCVSHGSDCLRVYIRFHDDQQRLFSTMGLLPALARIAAAQLIEEEEAVEKNGALCIGPIAGHA